MNISITTFCTACNKRQPQNLRLDETDGLILRCDVCGNTRHNNPEQKRIVLDGPPGSGKSTVLFGISEGENADTFHHTMRALGYSCVHESVDEAHKILGSQGIDFSVEKEAWLQTIIEIDLGKYFYVDAGFTFFDRCFHHWQLLSNATGITLPAWYEAVNKELRYSSPIFLCTPVKSMNLNDESILPSRRFTWEQRMQMFDDAKLMYQNLGYKVIEVPMFIENNIEQNNLERIKLILSELHLPLP